MPRDGGGTYTLPGGSTATTGTTILASEHNTPLNDIASALTASLPVDGSKGMSAPLKAADGSAALPGYTFGSETGSGLYRVSAGVVNASIQTTPVMSLTPTAVTIMTAANSLVGNPTGAAALSAGVGLGGGLAFSGGNIVLSGSIAPPQGRLTISTGVPVLSSDVTAAGTVYYTPYVGNLVPIYDGANFALKSFAELSCVLDAVGHASSKIYDLFVINDSGTIRLVTGPVWATVAVGGSARGTGAGTTELQRLNGLWTNKNSMTGRYNSTSVSVAANCGTYVGSIYIDATAAQVNCHLSYGQSRRWDIWNAYNRVPVVLRAGDSTASWSVGGAGAVRAQNGNAANSLITLQGLAESEIKYQLLQSAALLSNQTTSATTGYVNAGIGYNSSTVFSGKVGNLNQTWSNMSAGLAFNLRADLVAEYVAPPALGINSACACEQLLNSLSQTMYGTETNSLLTAEWLG